MNELIAKLKTQVAELNATFKEIEEAGLVIDGTIGKWKKGSDTASPFMVEVEVTEPGRRLTTD